VWGSPRRRGAVSQQALRIAGHQRKQRVTNQAGGPMSPARAQCASPVGNVEWKAAKASARPATMDGMVWSSVAWWSQNLR